MVSVDEQLSERELFARVRDEVLPDLTRSLIEEVGREVGKHPLPARHQWPGDVFETTREFLDIVGTRRLGRICEPGSIFERVGAEAARGGMSADEIATSIRLSNRLTHRRVHRALLDMGGQLSPDGLLDLLDRLAEAGDLVVTAVLTGHSAESAGRSGEDDVPRRLGGVLLHGGDGAIELAHECGWDDDAVVCAIITSPDAATVIRAESDCRVAFYPRSSDVILLHPIAEDQLATTLRPLLRGGARRADAQGRCIARPRRPRAAARERLWRSRLR